MYSQSGIQNSSKDPVRIPPATKLLQARNARTMRIEPLQIISNVVMPRLYNKMTQERMGIIP